MTNCRHGGRARTADERPETMRLLQFADVVVDIGEGAA